MDKDLDKVTLLSAEKNTSYLFTGRPKHQDGYLNKINFLNR